MCDDHPNISKYFIVFYILIWKHMQPHR
jgi:hypothetical protein